MTVKRRKLIEVALPLEAINRESAREKTIRHGHPASLHLWWARRPLAAARAVLFAQLVDDPSSHPDRFPTPEDQQSERMRLFDLLERLVTWENANDQAVLAEARMEILRSCDGQVPTVLDPFAGGGAIPLEAQRLGLMTCASDLNPVAVLINKALLEYPPKFEGDAPVFPGGSEARLEWPASTGLAEDVRLYGEWILQQARQRLLAHYPAAHLSDGSPANVVAWIWARTVECPNPACSLAMPLVRSWWISKKPGRATYVVPSIHTDVQGRPSVRFRVSSDRTKAPSGSADGTVNRAGATCVGCGSVVPLSYVREQGKFGRLGVQLLAVAAESGRRRHYLDPTPEHEAAAAMSKRADVLDTELPQAALGFRVQAYGMTMHSDLFTARQLDTIATFSDLVAEAHEKALVDARLSDCPNPEERAKAIALYLAFTVDRLADLGNSLCRWEPNAECPRHLFGRQAVSMTWDFAEGNPLGDASGSWSVLLEGAIRAFASPAFSSLSTMAGSVEQADAATRDYAGFVVATDPPYYDNVGYADLSDFFYVWMRRSLGALFPELLATVLTPKSEELVAEPFRHGGGANAERFFEDGFFRVFRRIRSDASEDFPVTVFYAFKQGELEGEGVASTGWQTLLEGILRAGWEVTGTWPIRTEASNRMRAQKSNALASSIVLSLRPRASIADAVTRRGFLSALKAELPSALKHLQEGSIAPVDLAQAAIGPGMAIFSRFTRVQEADGSDLSVRTALSLINQALDEVLAEQEGDFDAETRFAVKWFMQYGWNDAPSGEADVLTRAVNTTVSTLERGGIFRAAAGRARLLEPSEMTESWNPAEDKAISVWEVAIRLGHALRSTGTEQAARWMREAASRVDMDSVKELAYLMYSVCERKGWAESALLFNALGTSWSDVQVAARDVPSHRPHQETLGFDGDNE